MSQTAARDLLGERLTRLWCQAIGRREPLEVLVRQPAVAHAQLVEREHSLWPRDVRAGIDDLSPRGEVAKPAAVLGDEHDDRLDEPSESGNEVEQEENERPQRRLADGARHI